MQILPISFTIFTTVKAVIQIILLIILVNPTNAQVNDYLEDVIVKYGAPDIIEENEGATVMFKYFNTYKNDPIPDIKKDLELLFIRIENERVICIMAVKTFDIQKVEWLKEIVEDADERSEDIVKLEPMLWKDYSTGMKSKIVLNKEENVVYFTQWMP
ncbi:MAG: hypothetical protein R2753_01160 [Chitinophagales bacterium]